MFFLFSVIMWALWKKWLGNWWKKWHWGGQGWQQWQQWQQQQECSNYNNGSNSSNGNEKITILTARNNQPSFFALFWHAALSQVRSREFAIIQLQCPQTCWDTSCWLSGRTRNLAVWYGAGQIIIIFVHEKWAWCFNDKKSGRKAICIMPPTTIVLLCILS